jgi:hypothetical protein
MSNSLEEILRKEIEIQRRKQKEREDYVLSYSDSFLALILIVKANII